jgi:hypothetical protein
MEIRLDSAFREYGQHPLASGLLLVSWIAFVLFSSYAPLMASVSPRTAKSPRPMTIEQMTSQYMELRSEGGHFDGESWNADVDLWSGKKHLLMRALSHWLDMESADKQQVLKIMGEPDSTLAAGAGGYDELPKEARRGEVLIYFWRNRHDYLYFSCTGREPCSSSWWHAYE